MQAREIHIKADSDQEARVLAADKLKTTVSNILLTKDREGQFTASLIHCDAQLEIALSNDEMSAYVMGIVPARGEGLPLSKELVERQLKLEGLVIPPLPDAMETLLTAAARGQKVTKLLLIKGRLPEPARDAEVVPTGDWRYPVFPGDAIGTIKRALPAEEGKTVTGKKVPPRGERSGNGIIFPSESRTYIDKSSLQVRTDTYGLVEMEGQEIRVVPQITTSQDDMEVRATIFHKDHLGNPITAERMQAAMEAEDIGVTVDATALERGKAESAQKHLPVKHFIIARGFEPKHGRDGYFKMLYKDSRSDVGMEAEDGSIDFRTRGMIRSVQAGEILGRLYPPEKGKPGRDVFGRIIPAKEGEPCAITVGEGVETSPDGTEFSACEKGMVFFVENHLAVTDIYQTQGDVNIKTGNITIEKGSVHVQGAVLSGFSVESPRNILVDDVVENATLIAEGDIEIYGGFLMDKDGAKAKIQAGGNISALFATNATLEALKGSVIISHEITNCIVFAGEKVIASKGRGKIIGSTIRCAKGIEANEIGTPLGVETSIFLGIEPKDMSEFISRRKKLQGIIQKIHAALGPGDPKDILSKTRPEKRQAVTDLLKVRLRAENELLQIKAKVKKIKELTRKSMKARIRVHRTIHPGTIINCYGKTLHVDKPIEHSQIYYDRQADKIMVVSM